MKRMTRWLAGLLALCLCAAMLSGCAAWTFFTELFSGGEASSAESADASAEPSAESAEPVEPAVTVTVGSVTGEKGDTVLIPVDISAESRLVNADIYVRYDPDRLRAIKQYDADTEENRWTLDGIWPGSLWAAEPSEGLLHIMLATGDKGMTSGGTLFWLMFEVMDDLSTPAVLQPQAAVCGVTGDGGEDVDLAAQGLVAAVAGQVSARETPDPSTSSE